MIMMRSDAGLSDVITTHIPAGLATRVARWHDHVNGVQAAQTMQHWLTDSGSLTAKLMAHSQTFRVQRVQQRPGVCWADELAAIGMTRPGKAHVREVLLSCDGEPVVYAHTVLPLASTGGQWPLFRTLGEKSLGSTLFGDPKVRRGHLQFARLQHNHPAMQRARKLVQGTRSEAAVSWKADKPLFARRSLFFRCGGLMLVTELFLPSISELTHIGLV